YFRSHVSENCYYDPDLTLKTPQIIAKYAGAVEIYDVTTQDGYILKLFRIPRINPKGVILIHHSIATYSRIYLWQGNNSLGEHIGKFEHLITFKIIALTLWHNGYDVWLANHRGTSYSNKHVNMTTSDYSYWDFSFHEIGLYDVSSEIEFIRKKTNGMKIIYIGHSLGSGVGLVYASLKSDQARAYLKSMILLAPPCYLGHIAGAAVVFKGFEPIFKRFDYYTRS
ncbi:Abhydro lipase domain containing protein, partial [Asbolus verrucosus]